MNLNRFARIAWRKPRFVTIYRPRGNKSRIDARCHYLTRVSQERLYKLMTAQIVSDKWFRIELDMDEKES